MSGLPCFSVRNLGPISEGTVQLHPLTILVGKNNTGKTYMAQTIYAAYKALERGPGPARPLMSLDESDDLISRLQDESERDIDVLQGSFRRHSEGWMRSRLDRAGAALGERLTVYFDVDELDELRRWQREDLLDVSVRVASSGVSSTFLFGLQSDNTGGCVPLPAVTARDLYDSPISFLLNDLMAGLSEELITQESDKWRRRASNALASYLWDSHFLPSVSLDGTAYYLPAGRSGLLEAWTDVVRLRLRHDRDGLALSGRDPAALGGIALDFLSELQELLRPKPRRGPYHRSRYRKRRQFKKVESTARRLEELINGDVEFARGRERVPSLAYTQGERSIPVQRASSMIAELAPLLSWIKHVLVPGDLILIDEPEAHMHPEAVLAVAETLVALAHSGVRVLCTTHSSEFLHQVSNCMLRSASQSVAPHSEAISIDVADLGVYRFDRPNLGSGTRIVHEEIDPNWGIPEDEYIAVAERLAEETADLLSTDTSD